MVFSQKNKKKQGGGSPRVNKKSNLKLANVFFFSVSMQNHSRTPKTCFTLGLEFLCHIYSKALKVARESKILGKEGQYYKRKNNNTDQISKLTKCPNFDQNSEFIISTKYYNFNQISDFQPKGSKFVLRQNQNFDF